MTMKSKTTVQELIGPARKIADLFIRKTQNMKSGGDKLDPILLWGPPGTGKSTVAGIVSDTIAGHDLAIEHINGQELTVERVRDWRRSTPYKLIFGDNIVKFIDEIDQASKPALGELRTYLDTLPSNTFVIATTNKQPEELDESIQSRFYDRQCTGASELEIVRMLQLAYSNMPTQDATAIARASQGNVRVAKIDARKWNDAHE